MGVLLLHEFAELAVFLVLEPSQLDAVVPPVQEFSPRPAPCLSREEGADVELSLFERAHVVPLLLGEFCVEKRREEKRKEEKRGGTNLGGGVCCVCSGMFNAKKMKAHGKISLSISRSISRALTFALAVLDDPVVDEGALSMRSPAEPQIDEKEERRV